MPRWACALLSVTAIACAIGAAGVWLAGGSVDYIVALMLLAVAAYLLGPVLARGCREDGAGR